MKPERSPYKYNSLTNYGGLQIDKYGTWNVFASTGLAEKRVEGVVSATDGLVRRHLPVRLDTVLKTVELPTGISNLDTGLSDVDRSDKTT